MALSSARSWWSWRGWREEDTSRHSLVASSTDTPDYQSTSRADSLQLAREVQADLEGRVVKAKEGGEIGGEEEGLACLVGIGEGDGLVREREA